MTRLKYFITAILLSTITFAFGQDYDQLITTYEGKSAIIKVEKSPFENNMFSLTLDITWVNKHLKPTSERKEVLAANLEQIKITPQNSVIIQNPGKLTDFSNSQIKIDFGLNPKFSGGDVEISIPLVSAKDMDHAKALKFSPILYANPRTLKVKYFIDSSKIVDNFPPVLEVLYPKVNPAIDPDYPIVNDKTVTIHISAVDKSGVKEVLVDDQPAKMQFPGHYVKAIRLNTGMNTINIKATDNAGNTVSIDYNIVCTYQYDINLNGGKYYALFVAVNDYQDPNIPDLTNPISDATKLIQTLENDYMFDSTNIYFLKNPTRSQIINTLDQLSNTLTNRDNLLIFYAGHGFWDEFKEIGYWMPSDAKINDKSTWLRNSTVKDYIGAINSLHTLLITDACFSGSIFKTRGGMNVQNVVAYQKIYQLPSRKAMTSGTLKEVPDRSIFLQTLVLQLKTNTDKYLPASKLFEQVRIAVLNNTPNVPQYGTIQDVGDQGGEFIFIHR